MVKSNILFVGVLFYIILVASISPSYAEYTSPKKQIELGVLPEDVICRDGKVLVIRNNGKVACVHDSTAEKLKWNIIKTEFIQKEDRINSKIQAENLSNSVGITNNTDDYSNITTNNTNEIISVNIQSGNLIKNIPYPMFVQKISDERLITSSNDIKNGSSYSGGSSPWPKTTLDTPFQVKLGEPFDVTFTWSMVEFDKETGEIDDISPDDPNTPGVGVVMFTRDGTQLVSASGFEITAERTNHYDITTTEYTKIVEYDDTEIHSETLTFQIDEPIRHPYNSIVIWADGHDEEIYLTYFGDTVFLTNDQITTNISSSSSSLLARSFLLSEPTSEEKSFS